MKRAIFPGSFDPITVGHVDIINRGLGIFDEIIIALGINADKKYMFSSDQRKAFIESTFKSSARVKVMTYEGLTVSFCEKVEADFILRGLRNPADFEFEKAIAHTNQLLSGIETVFLLTEAKTAFISSSIVRDVMRNGGNYTDLVPEAVTF